MNFFKKIFASNSTSSTQSAKANDPQVSTEPKFMGTIKNLMDCHNAVLALMEGVQNGQYKSQWASLVGLDMVLKVPPTKEYFQKIASLLNVVCKSEHWMLPMFQRLKDQPDRYAVFVAEVMGVGTDFPPRYFILGLREPEIPAKARIPSAMKERMEAILACAEDGRPEVQKVGRATLHLIAHDLMYPRFTDNPDDLIAWRNWLIES
jgi:hypothetical protein